jgi:succinate dehydrogenase (ubiquinone) cytochrome b560 subunit
MKAYRRAMLHRKLARDIDTNVLNRLAATNNVNQSEGNEILANQRLRRPTSPHLSIYKPQITWYGSGLNRLTAVVLSGSLYLFGFAYLAAPALGWHLETQSLVAAVASWPAPAKVAAKLTLAMPFFYHALNGIRHLAWDLGYGFKNVTVMRTGWTVVGLSAVATLYYAFIG